MLASLAAAAQPAVSSRQQAQQLLRNTNSCCCQVIVHVGYAVPLVACVMASRSLCATVWLHSFGTVLASAAALHLHIVRSAGGAFRPGLTAVGAYLIPGRTAALISCTCRYCCALVLFSVSSTSTCCIVQAATHWRSSWLFVIFPHEPCWLLAV
jgi:hypothetical protein